MRTVYFHEDDYCQLEVLPLTAKDFCCAQMDQIAAFAADHQRGAGYTDIYIRESCPQEMKDLHLQAEQLKITLAFLPVFDRVDTGYSSYRVEAAYTKAMGYSNDLAVFWSENETGFVDKIWLSLWMKAENQAEARQLLCALGTMGPLLLADWAWGVYVDLTDEEAIACYIKENLAK